MMNILAMTDSLAKLIANGIESKAHSNAARAIYVAVKPPAAGVQEFSGRAADYPRCTRSVRALYSHRSLLVRPSFLTANSTFHS
ncbi:MAG TPA: hypothetical protein VF452_09920, partial [Candidatus Binatia bacterium]